MPEMRLECLVVPDRVAPRVPSEFFGPKFQGSKVDT